MGDELVCSKDEAGEMLRGGRDDGPKRVAFATLFMGGNRIPPSGAWVGENKGPFETVDCRALSVRI